MKASKYLGCFVVLSCLLVSCSTTYLSFKNSAKEASVKEVYENGALRLISQKQNSTVVLTCEKVAIGSPELTVLINIFVGENCEESLINPLNISAVGKINQIESVPLIAQEPDRYVLTQQKRATRAATWAAIGNAFSAAVNETNMATASKQNNYSAVTASAIKQQQLKDDATKNNQLYKANLSAIGTSSTEFLRMTTLSKDLNQAGGKVVFAPTTGKVQHYTEISINVPVGNEVHTFILDASEFKI